MMPSDSTGFYWTAKARTEYVRTRKKVPGIHGTDWGGTNARSRGAARAPITGRRTTARAELRLPEGWIPRRAGADERVRLRLVNVRVADIHNCCI